MKVFIIMKNRLTWPKAMCEFLADTGSEVILIDNASTYQPLLDWYDTCPYTVHRMEKNYGHLVFWKSGLCNVYTDRFYIVTDHDLDLSGVPHDYADFLMKGLENNVVKSGLSLRINDLPNNPYAMQAFDWELKFWQTKQDKNGFFNSDIDTTLAVYDRERKFGFPPESNTFFSAVRSPEPYTARHLPWYLTPGNMTEEERYYHERTDKYWSGKFKKVWNS